MSTKEALPAILSIVFAIVAVVLLILFGWFVVWKMFLVRFSFIRELVYGGSNGNNNKKTKEVPATPLRRSSRIRDMRPKTSEKRS